MHRQTKKRTGIPMDAGFFVSEPQLHFISPSKIGLEKLLWMCRQVAPWVTRIHLRQKTLTQAELLRWGKALIEEGGIDREQLTVNGSPWVAAELGCGAVHLPEAGPSPAEVRNILGSVAEVGCSVHSLEAARRKAANGADYLFFGHVFKTASKRGYPPRGLEELKALCAGVSLPVIALGGVTVERISELKSVGAAGVAVISAIADAPCPGEEAERLATILRVSWTERSGW
ncbi:thiamine phosphate synthase [Salinithrix halophila]|uniref:Thiamine phosphate synthase n=1 Tax=Salinithrix halophila TaxID=1485204 RepID=A0ABV8JE68_9BACL